MSDDRTRMFSQEPSRRQGVDEVLQAVKEALAAKGYNPVVQIVGFLLSGDPAYITAHQSARQLIRKIPRDEILEELVRRYLDL